MSSPDSSEVTSRYSEIEGVEIDPEQLPEELRHLLPFAERWAIGDDVERARYMFDTPERELQEFVDAVWPLIPRIQEWCGEHRDETPVPDEVVMFDMMCEAVTEANNCHIGLEETITLSGAEPNPDLSGSDSGAPFSEPSLKSFAPAAWMILTLLLVTVLAIIALSVYLF